MLRNVDFLFVDQQIQKLFQHQLVNRTISATPFASFQSSMDNCNLGAPPQPWTSSSSPFALYQTSMHSSSSPSAPYQYTMHNFTPRAPFQSWISFSRPFAPYQTSMHSSFSPSAPYQYTMHNSNPSAHQTRMSQSSPSAPPQAPIGSSNPVQASRSSFFQAYANQSNSNPIAPPNLGSSPTPRPRRKRMVTSETPNASKNASRYMGAIKFARSQSSMHGPKK